MKEYLQNVLLGIACVAFFGLVVFGSYSLTKTIMPIYAAPLAKQQEAGCVPFAKLGMQDIFRCYDDTNGKTFYVNNLGFMVYVGD